MLTIDGPKWLEGPLAYYCDCLQTTVSYERGGMVAYIVFSQPEEVDCALQMCSSREIVRCEVTRTGVLRWCEEYSCIRLAAADLNRTAVDIVGR